MQKFTRGNLVRIADDLGESMSHFEKGKNAVILYSYKDEYGGHNDKEYGVIFPDNGREVSWYHEHQLTLLEEGGEHLVKEAKANKKTVHTSIQDQFKKAIIDAYNAGWGDCENKGLDEYSAEKYYHDTFETNKSLN